MEARASNFCPIHKCYFGKGFGGRGKRRCYQCEKEQNSMEPKVDFSIDYLGNVQSTINGERCYALLKPLLLYSILKTLQDIKDNMSHE